MGLFCCRGENQAMWPFYLCKEAFLGAIIQVANRERQNCAKARNMITLSGKKTFVQCVLMECMRT